jgi:hypothetical protein
MPAGCEILSFLQEGDHDGGADFLDGGCGSGLSAVVWASDGSGQNGSMESRFDTAKTGTLYLAAFTCGVYGAHSGHFSLTDPAGKSYARLGIQFKNEGEGTNARRYGGGYIIEVALPIAGTDIRAKGIVGWWTAGFFLDGGDTALGTGVFELYK